MDIPDNGTNDTSSIATGDSSSRKAVLSGVDRTNGGILHARPDKVVRAIHQTVKLRSVNTLTQTNACERRTQRRQRRGK